MKGTDCGDGVFAGGNTSCPFAKNVHEAYFAVPGDSVEVEAFSPVTGQTYTMACVRTGDTVTCRGGKQAVVTFNYHRGE
jgi:hypothetical protein